MACLNHVVSGKMAMQADAATNGFCKCSSLRYAVAQNQGMGYACVVCSEAFTHLMQKPPTTVCVAAVTANMTPACPGCLVLLSWCCSCQAPRILHMAGPWLPRGLAAGQVQQGWMPQSALTAETCRDR